MAKEEKDKINQEVNNSTQTETEEKENTAEKDNKVEGTAQENKEDQSAKESDEKEQLSQELAELKDKYLRLYSEFENFRRRTAKERTELIKTANEEVLFALLPILDDFERAMKSINESSEVKSLKEGINLIYSKLFKALESKGLKPMDCVGKEFNSELHEAISQTPVSDDMKGKVVAEVEKGYYLQDKVIRFAKVVIGS
jgi:molecular chaperone GrpE